MLVREEVLRRMCMVAECDKEGVLAKTVDCAIANDTDNRLFAEAV